MKEKEEIKTNPLWCPCSKVPAAEDPLGPFVCVEWVSSREWTSHRMSDKQTPTGEVVWNLNVFFKTSIRLFMQKTIRKLGDILTRYK